MHSRNEATATLLQNGKVLVAGGFIDNQKLTNTSEIYDPTTNTWSEGPVMTFARADVGASLRPDGTVVIAGGYRGGQVFASSSEIYSPGNGGSFTPGPMLGAGRSSFGAATLDDGTFIIAGGYLGNAQAATAVDVLGPNAVMFKSFNLLTPRMYGPAVQPLPGGKVIVFAGNNYQTGALDSAEVFDGQASHWTGSMSTPRQWVASAALLDGTVLAIGGIDRAVTNLKSIERYDPNMGMWAPAGAMSGTRAYCRAAVVPSGKVLIAGGGFEQANYNWDPPFKSTEVYDPNIGTTTPGPDLTEGRLAPTVTVLQDGSVLVVGGANAIGPSSAVDRICVH